MIAREILLLGVFALFIFLLLAIDLGLFTKSDQSISVPKAIIMNVLWVTLALGFYLLIYHYGHVLHQIDNYNDLQEASKYHFHNLKFNPLNFQESLKHYRSNLALEFLTGYLIEYALSVDNMFVILLIFSTFYISRKYYHRVLFWGILGALSMRLLFIFLGSVLIREFNMILYFFGAFLAYSGILLFVNRNKKTHMNLKDHKLLRLVAKYFPVYPGEAGAKFFVKKDGKIMVTTLFLVLLLIEFSDIIFALDSIPAIFSVTKDPYIVFSSNIFAVMGLRSMFFLLAHVIDRFHYLKVGLSFLLVFIGVKMILHGYLQSFGFTTIHALMMVLVILGASVGASILFPKKEQMLEANS